jgi:hypothetical protein
MRCGTEAAGGGDADYYRHDGVTLKYFFTGNDLIHPKPASPKAITGSSLQLKCAEV